MSEEKQMRHECTSEQVMIANGVKHLTRSLKLGHKWIVDAFMEGPSVEHEEFQEQRHIASTEFSDDPLLVELVRHWEDYSTYVRGLIFR